MEHMIEKLIDEFAQGKISRRQLVKNLAFTAAAAAGAGAVPAIAAEPALKASSINHISYQVKDYKKSRDFYVNMLGMKVAADDEKRQLPGRRNACSPHCPQTPPPPAGRS